MKHISILVPEGDTSLSNLEATHKMFTMANGHLERTGQPLLFDVHLVGRSKESQVSSGIFSVKPDCTIREVEKTDLIIIPAIHGDIHKILKLNLDFVPWINEQYAKGAEVASLCIGAFLLAKTGLLDGKSCATHWLMTKEFREMYPEVNLVDDKIITDERGIYTSGGAYSSLNLNLYLIEKFVGRDMAVLSSKIFEIDINRQSQSPFIIFKGQKYHSDIAVKEAQEYIEVYFNEKLTVDGLSAQFSLGRRTFERRFKKATSNTVIEYIQRVRVEAAKKKLEANRISINEVMYDVGYNDAKTFRELFKKLVGMSPAEYRTRYYMEVLVD
ncbi:GlxA family transcriptional regulator [Cyclobacterium qasimii]|uniref:Transcriptional regulator, AraC family n=2 Tax=Cyclobacterium qasimii TaxID=1350429 RepID=S7WYW8_9BACT|nr:helix-turn-helix domain-containing protein [Cyclobacterium qasimii]EPR69123.1 transcriptional regulator, AraC family [Cyclobacterium qasimii M12-11B]GEO22520.1 AraC family transcriptional regulator [Cyclobacterium qasimii]